MKVSEWVGIAPTNKQMATTAIVIDRFAGFVQIASLPWETRTTLNMLDEILATNLRKEDFENVTD
jgi:hypothetical protein